MVVQASPAQVASSQHAPPPSNSTTSLLVVPARQKNANGLPFAQIVGPREIPWSTRREAPRRRRRGGGGGGGGDERRARGEDGEQPGEPEAGRGIRGGQMKKKKDFFKRHT